MLILQRKAGQMLQIGDSITVTVVSVEEGRVRLAIDAPRDVRILRSELLKAAETNQEAANEESLPLALLSVLEKGAPPEGEA